MFLQVSVSWEFNQHLEPDIAFGKDTIFVHYPLNVVSK